MLNVILQNLNLGKFEQQVPEFQGSLTYKTKSSSQLHVPTVDTLSYFVRMVVASVICLTFCLGEFKLISKSHYPFWNCLRYKDHDKALYWGNFEDLPEELT